MPSDLNKPKDRRPTGCSLLLKLALDLGRVRVSHIPSEKNRRAAPAEMNRGEKKKLATQPATSAYTASRSHSSSSSSGLGFYPPHDDLPLRTVGTIGIVCRAHL